MRRSAAQIRSRPEVNRHKACNQSVSIQALSPKAKGDANEVACRPSVGNLRAQGPLSAIQNLESLPWWSGGAKEGEENGEFRRCLSMRPIRILPSRKPEGKGFRNTRMEHFRNSDTTCPKTNDCLSKRSHFTTSTYWS